jgi:hypothetical protein
MAQQRNEREDSNKLDNDLSPTTRIGRPSTLLDSFILNSRSSIHIYNNYERFILWDLIDSDYHITIGNTCIYAKGTRSV